MIGRPWRRHGECSSPQVEAGFGRAFRRPGIPGVRLAGTPFLASALLLGCAAGLLASCTGSMPSGSGQESLGQASQIRFGGLAIRLELAAPAARRAVSGLAGFIDEVRLQISGRNVPPDTPPFVVNRSQFKNDQATVTIGNLLPGPVHLDVTLLDAADLVLGIASGDATVSAGTNTPIALAIDPRTGQTSVTIDPKALGEPPAAPLATPSLALAMQAVPPGTWAPGPPLTIARAGLGAGMVGGKLFAVSGDGNLSLELYDPAAGTWTPALLPPYRELKVVLAGAATVRDQIVLLGGDSETGGTLAEQIGPVYIAPGAGAGGMARVLPITTSVPAEADQAFWRTAAGVTAIGDLAYVVGGVSQRLDTSATPGSNGYVHPAATEVLDVGRGVWFQRSPIPTPRAGLGVAVSQGKIVAAGGYRWLGGTGDRVDPYQKLPYVDAAIGTISVLSTVEVYDPSTDTWTGAPSLAVPRHSAAMAASGGRVYVLGGADALGRVLESVESWAPGETAWRAEPPMGTARALCAAAVAPDGLIAVLGGLDSNGTPLRTVEFFNPGGAP